MKHLTLALGLFAPLLLLSSQFDRTASAGASAQQSNAQAVCEYWVAPPPEGSNGNPGTNEQPWATLGYAAAAVPDNGCTIWVKPGIYSGEQRLSRRFTTPTLFQSVLPYQAILQNSGLTVSVSGAMNLTLEGFVFQHSGPGATPLVVQIDPSSAGWAEMITLRNNIFRDSYNNDLLKIVAGVRFVTIENNVFYNQGPSEEHIDVNGITDALIQDNIFFNDFAGSGRADHGNAHSFITIKDSNGNLDGQEGSERITVRRNVFFNWEGRKDTFIQVGNDGKPYHEAKDVQIENNLMLGNSAVEVYATLGVRGVSGLTFANNTVVGDMPSSSYAMWVSLKELNPLNENISFYNNIWSDPMGTMGAGLGGGSNEFSNGSPAQTVNLVLDNNLYWNGGMGIPPGDLLSPMVDDPRLHVADPLLNTNQTGIVLPRWNGSAFPSGNSEIRQEFIRLVELYGNVPGNSPVVGAADPAFAPLDDILGRPRSTTPALGAYEILLGEPSPTPTATETALPSATPTETATSTATPEPTNTPEPSPTAVPTATASPSPSPTPSPFLGLYLSTDNNGPTTIGNLSGVYDEDVVYFDGVGWSMLFDGSDVGMGSVDIEGFHLLDSDTLLLVVSKAMVLGSVAIDPFDVVQFDATALGTTTAGSFSLYFDGNAAGLSSTGEEIDAIALLPDGRLLVSAEGNVEVPNVSGKDEDILAFTPLSLGLFTNGTWEMYFDGSDVALSGGEDVDATGVDAAGNLYLSALDPFAVTGLAGDDEDVFHCAPASLGEDTACTYASALYLDGSAWGLAADDVDAVHVP